MKSRSTADTYEKPRSFRDRSKKRRGDTKREVPQHQPYEREHKNWTHSTVVDGLGEEWTDEDDTDSCREGHCSCDE